MHYHHSRLLLPRPTGARTQGQGVVQRRCPPHTHTCVRTVHRGGASIAAGVGNRLFCSRRRPSHNIACMCLQSWCTRAHSTRLAQPSPNATSASTRVRSSRRCRHCDISSTRLICLRSLLMCTYVHELACVIGVEKITIRTYLTHIPSSCLLQLINTQALTLHQRHACFYNEHT